jgi:hypothetical protein
VSGFWNDAAPFGWAIGGIVAWSLLFARRPATRAEGSGRFPSLDAWNVPVYLWGLANTRAIMHLLEARCCPTPPVVEIYGWLTVSALTLSQALAIPWLVHNAARASRRLPPLPAPAPGLSAVMTMMGGVLLSAGIVKMSFGAW